MAKQIEFAAVESLLTEWVTSFTEALNKQTKALTNIFEDWMNYGWCLWFEREGRQYQEEKWRIQEANIKWKRIINKLEQKDFVIMKI